MCDQKIVLLFLGLIAINFQQICAKPSSNQTSTSEPSDDVTQGGVMKMVAGLPLIAWIIIGINIGLIVIVAVLYIVYLVIKRRRIRKNLTDCEINATAEEIRNIRKNMHKLWQNPKEL